MFKVGDRVEVRPPLGCWWRGVVVEADGIDARGRPAVKVRPDPGQAGTSAPMRWVEVAACVPAGVASSGS
jgi:hypothetical protein